MRTNNPPPADDAGRRLAEVRRRIEAACARAGRDAGGVTLIGASKRQPIQRLEAAIAAGLRVFGESRIQEAIEKIPRLGYRLSTSGEKLFQVLAQLDKWSRAMPE